ncbi:hypothetical protein QOZ80_2AG0133740 [Eleusine coracana subsp. coracana]|nr:hypothetical protein QOZ80_2AG0133740 [Eleusine coracana subsp. coracana]
MIEEHGPLGVQYVKEIAAILLHHFGIRKHEVHIYRCAPDPCVATFSESAARDLVFAAGRVIDGPVELSFHAWDLDRFGDRASVPFHIKISIEGIPHHAWYQEIADKVLCDEAVIHFVDEDTRNRVDLRAYNCWAFCQDPSRLPQVVYLTLLKHEVDPWRNASVHFVRLRGMKKVQVFKVFIHIDSVEDLLFYHYPREDLLAEGRVPWRDFQWQYGKADGELEEDELRPPTRYCGPDQDHHWQPRDDEDRDKDHKRPHPAAFLRRVSGCFESGGRSKDRNAEPDGWSGWYRGESSRGRVQTLLTSHPAAEATFQGQRYSSLNDGQMMDRLQTKQAQQANSWPNSDAIIITPIQSSLMDYLGRDV